MQSLYPLKFQSLFFEKIWGGSKLKTTFGKNCDELKNCGESWDLSGIEGSISVVSNGFLEGNELDELIEVYMGDLVGDKVYEKFGLDFPLLIKIIDANDHLSVQVHPNDELAKERHLSFGKTEMWYVLQADEKSNLICGFNKPLNKETYLNKVENKELKDILNFVPATAGDVFFMPAGQVHAIGKGILLVEIQQTSDITYRIYDYDRVDANGNQRELHTDLAVDAIDFNHTGIGKVDYQSLPNQRAELVNCTYFNTGLLEFNTVIEKDIYGLDSFVIYICVEGEYEIISPEHTEHIHLGETVLIPASLHQYKLKPVSPTVKVLEVHL